MNMFLSGNEAVAAAVRLARPQVIAAYPITPQTTVIERLAEMVEDGSLASEYLHVESEHSALSACIGASAVGARTFTASSSQGLLYMAECMHYASGGRFPIVMMNANRSVALPWNIYGDQRDSLSLLDSGWIQAYAEDAQEAFDMLIQAFAVAEHPLVLTPAMVNLDGFALTHTYELVNVPDPSDVDAFLPRFTTANRMDPEHPVSLGFTAGPQHNQAFKQLQHLAMLASGQVIREAEERFGQRFGRSYPGLVETYRCEDAERVIVTLGSVAGTVRPVVDRLRSTGERVGLLRIRYMRPFPDGELRAALAGATSVGVLEKDISFGYEGTVFTNVNSAFARSGASPRNLLNFIGGLGGKDITPTDIENLFARLAAPEGLETVTFI
ncbi:MAG: pyruvate ferredoxin oxidoreductase [Chlorobiaceae bacterium]|nr:pyruvate ferredoxin oxidoreductase [Chlorobiaceae bacterium]